MKDHTTTNRAEDSESRLLWATAILGTAEFSDARLAQRAVAFLSQKAAAPGDGIARGARTPAAAKGCYRFLENARVKATSIWEAVHTHTAKGLNGAERVVVAHDTTTLMFPGLKETTGLGTVDRPQEEALLMHSSLAICPDGAVLGLLHNHVWARPLAEFGKGEYRKKRPTEQKESFEWIRGVRHSTELRDRHSGGTQLVHVMDRGGDVHEVLQEIVANGQDAVIRCCQNRRVEGEYGHIRETLSAQPVLNRHILDVPRKRGRAARRATVEIRSTELTLCPPKIYGDRGSLSLQAVWVHEPSPPDGVEGLDWLLLTTLPTKTAMQCSGIVDIYKLRWRIEEFHLVLKSGCKIESTQLKTSDRIEVFLSLCCAVAVRILQMTYLARIQPDAPCTLVLSEEEWQMLWGYNHNKPASQAHDPPTIREAVRMIGRLGGHLGRKCDGMPGVRVLWRGWRDFQLLLEGYRVAR